MEGPCQGVGVPFPAGGKAFADLAAAVVLHQRVHAVGAVVQVRVGRADEIVQGGGLTGVQHSVGGAAVTGGSTARRGAAAAAQQDNGKATVRISIPTEYLSELRPGQRAEVNFIK